MNCHGFTLVREEELREAGGRVRLWKHDVTGAELLSICNDDETSPSASASARRPGIPRAWPIFSNIPCSAVRTSIP